MPVKDLPSVDLLGLTLAPMSERLAALRIEWGRHEQSGPLPSRAVQVAGLVVGETVRLIRLGDRSEVTGAARELSKLVAQNTPDAATRHPESYRLAAGASVVLGAAGSPSSAGAELTVLNSWNGKALEAVELLNRAHDRTLARSELRSQLGDLTESHLTHLLRDLEAAGLALRIKEGRMVTVHLGPSGKSDHVQARLAKDPLPVRFRGTERDIDPGARRRAAGEMQGLYYQPLNSSIQFQVKAESKAISSSKPSFAPPIGLAGEGSEWMAAKGPIQSLVYIASAKRLVSFEEDANPVMTPDHLAAVLDE